MQSTARVFLAATLLLAASLHAAAPSAGSLVIIGGAIAKGNDAFYQKMITLGPKDANVGVVPTASGVPEEVGPERVADFNRLTSRTDTRTIAITKDTPDAAKKPEVAQSIEECELLFFVGGDQSRILNAFRPGGTTTPSYDAVVKVLNNGGVVGGTSAGAAMMSDPMIKWGTSEDALLLGVQTFEDSGVGYGQGMGFFPYGLTDQHFLKRGRLGRLIVATLETKNKFGFGIDENAALVADLKTGLLECMGDPGVLVLDAQAAERDGFTIKNLYISLLSTGDQVKGATGFVVPAPGKVVLPRPTAPNRGPIIKEDAWASDVIPQMIAELADTTNTEAVAKAGTFTVMLSKMPKTEFFRDPAKGPSSLTAKNIRVDIVPGPATQEAADKAKAQLVGKVTAP